MTRSGSTKRLGRVTALLVGLQDISTHLRCLSQGQAGSTGLAVGYLYLPVSILTVVLVVGTAISIGPAYYQSKGASCLTYPLPLIYILLEA
jgi:hypothetical protein